MSIIICADCERSIDTDVADTYSSANGEVCDGCDTGETQQTEQAIANIELEIAQLRNRPDIGDFFNDIISLSQMLVDLGKNIVGQEQSSCSRPIAKTASTCTQTAQNM